MDFHAGRRSQADRLDLRVEQMGTEDSADIVNRNFIKSIGIPHREKHSVRNDKRKAECLI